MNDEKKIDNSAIERIRTLQKHRKKILNLPPEKALDYILERRHPAAVVHSFAEEDFHFLIHDIGVEDARPLISLASNRQWQHCLDVETWHQDQLDNEAVTRWMEMLFRAEPDRAVRWFAESKAEFLEMFFFKNLEIRIREIDQDPPDRDSDFFTDDDTYYVRIIEPPTSLEAEERQSEYEARKRRRDFLSDFIRRLSAHDHVRYQQILHEAIQIVPAESEEDEYRWRNVRLAEKGFLSFDEAVGVYQPLDPAALLRRTPKQLAPGSETVSRLPAPMASRQMLDDSGLFPEAMRQIDSPETIEQLQLEFSALCNQIIAADQAIVRSRQALEIKVKKTSGYIGIGLERLTRKTGAEAVQPAAELIRRHALSDLFRVGYGLALTLKWRAERWRKTSWFEKAGLPLNFWGESWLGVLGGLLIKKPQYYDNYLTGVLYREFNTLNDIDTSRETLNQIIAVDSLLAAMDIQLKSEAGYRWLSYQNLILTLWARHQSGLPDGVIPLSMNEFKVFFNTLWDSPQPPRQTSAEAKTSFLTWMSRRTGLSPVEITRRIGPSLDALFETLDHELGQVMVKDLTARYIHLFLVKQD